MFKLELQWKEFNVSLPAINEKMAQDYNNFAGNQALESHLELWFSEDISQEDRDAIQAYWDSLTEESEEATSYMSREDIAADKAAKIASARTKLAGLGLTEEEIDAILG